MMQYFKWRAPAPFVAKHIMMLPPPYVIVNKLFSGGNISLCLRAFVNCKVALWLAFRVMSSSFFSQCWYGLITLSYWLHPATSQSVLVLFCSWFGQFTPKHVPLLGAQARQDNRICKLWLSFLKSLTEKQCRPSGNDPPTCTGMENHCIRCKRQKKTWQSQTPLPSYILPLFVCILYSWNSLQRKVLTCVQIQWLAHKLL